MLSFTTFSLFLALAAAQSDRCNSRGVSTYVKCPEVDQDFSFDFFSQCAGLSQFGCSLKLSKKIPGKFSCSLDETSITTGKICPGDKVVFDSIDASRIKKVSFTIDLNAAPIRTDFYLLSDGTGGMSPAINSVKSKFNLLIEHLDSSETDLAFGVGFYGDETELDNGFKNAQSLSTNLELSRTAVNALRAKGGRDFPSANLAALYQVATSDKIGWRANSRRIVVYFGDTPGHEPSCVGGGPLTRINVANALKKARISVSAVDVGEMQLDGATTAFGCGGAGAGSGQARHITEATGGVYARVNSPSRVVETIRSFLKSSIPRKFVVDEGECAKWIKSNFSPKNPWLILPGESITVRHEMEFPERARRICASGGPVECSYRISDEGGELPATTTKFVNVKVCPGN